MAEGIDQRGQSFGTRLNYFASQHIAVDDDAATLCECRRQRRLSGTDATGKPDAQHP